METTNKRALDFATEAHRGQLRNYTGEPYITHPIAVAKMVADRGYSGEVIDAALLHDVVEDTEITHDDILGEFGEGVSKIVQELTDCPHDYGNRRERKRADRLRLSNASNPAKIIKLADIIDNAKSITEHDVGFANTYIIEKFKLLKVLGRADTHLYDVAKGMVDEYITTVLCGSDENLMQLREFAAEKYSNMPLAKMLSDSANEIKRLRAAIRSLCEGDV